jgi:hypothetical protein
VTRSLGFVIVVLLLALAACGDAGDRGTAATTRTRAVARPPASDEARAERALIRLADFPRVWRAERGTLVKIRCGTLKPYDGSIVLLTTRRLTRDHIGVQQRIAVFPSVAGARTGLQRLDSRAAAGCLRRELQRYVSTEAGGPATPPQLARFDRIGPNAQARRYISTAISSFGKVFGSIDAVHVRVGRALVALTLVSGPSPPEAELYDHVVHLVLRRLHAVLG